MYGLFGGMFGGMYMMQAQMAAGRAETAAAKSQSRTTRMATEIRMLTERLDKLILVNMALWSLVQEKTGLTEKDLEDRVEQIDLEDGVADGKVTRTVSECPNCGRRVSARHKRCLFCGNKKIGSTSLDQV